MDIYLNWDDRKKEVLREFTLTGKISVAASFMLDEDDKEENDNQHVEKAKQKLAMLEGAAKGTVEMSQTQYEQRIAKLQKDLQRAWNSNQRVTSLKIAIQCSKLLAEPKVPRFYPSMFVLVAEILDTFGRLVFDRLKTVAEEENLRMGGRGRLHEDFNANDVGAEARETCRNWFYKTSCIRELLPRLYVEMSLLECYRFIGEDSVASYASTLLRLAHSIRGIGNPLVAVYARWYLARQAMRLMRDNGKARETILSCVSDYLFTFKEISSGTRTAQMEALGLDMHAYLNLHSPAVGWLMHQAAQKAPKEVFQGIMQQYRDWCGSAMVLVHIIDAFNPTYWSSFVQTMLTLCKEAKPAGTTPADIYRALSHAFVKAPPPQSMRITFLNEAWKAITKVNDPVVYAKNAIALIDLLLTHYTEREVLILLSDLVKRLQIASAAASTSSSTNGSGGYTHTHAPTAPPAALPYLERLLTSLVEAEVRRMGVSSANGTSFSGIITSEYFGKLLDMFASDAKPALCRRLLAALVSVPGAVTDAIVVNTMFEVARTVHDSLDLLSPPEELSSAANLITAFMGKIDFGRDLERQLEILMDCRQSFTSIDALKGGIINAQLDLAMRALNFVKGRHTAKTSSFVRAIFASAATSIACLDDPFRRMEIAQKAAYVALQNGCISQADLLYRAAIQEIPELPSAVAVNTALTGIGDNDGLIIDERLCILLIDFTKGIIPMPGHPDHGPFYLARGLLNAIQKFPWSKGSASVQRSKAVLLLLPVLHAYAQDPLPGRIPGVDSNDVLYAGESSYKEELKLIQRNILELYIGYCNEAKAAADADPGSSAKGVLTTTIPELLKVNVINGILDLDIGTLPAIEAATLLLKGVAPDHPLVKSTIQHVQEKIKMMKK